MSEITTVFRSLQPLLSTALFRQLILISEALLMMQGRVTMLGISRWTRRGGSYRTIQRFFASIYSRPVSGIAFQTLSLINVKTRRSWPILMEQIAPKPPQKKPATVKQKRPSKKAAKRSWGRPKGSKNKNQRQVILNAEMTQVKAMLTRLLILLGDTGKSSHVILFSTDHELGWEALVDYYRLRFQIEFNFRDAKQHWGLDE